MNEDGKRFIRYASTENGNRNTLYVCVPEEGEELYFGIARCNAKHDNFEKRKGRMIARNRAIKALSENIVVKDAEEEFYVSSNNGLYGCASKEHLGKVFKYFYGLDS